MRILMIILLTFGLNITSVVANDLINLMKSDLNQTQPKGCPYKWCACYLDMILAEAGYEQLGSFRARDFKHYGEPAKPGQVGSIMVMRNHVAVVVGKCNNGRIKTISGNYSRRVKIGCEPVSKAIAWRLPVGGKPTTLMELFN